MSDIQPTRKTQLRVAPYIRMSSTDQKDSPARQWDQIIPYIQEKGYHLVVPPRDPDLIYQDLSLRGDADRPGLDRLIRDAQAGLFDVIVIDEGSRLSRQEEDDFVAEVRRPLRRAGMLVDVVGKGIIDWDTIQGRLLSVFNQEQARLEPIQNSRRVLSNGVALMKAGRVVPGGPPFGYRWQYREEDLGKGRIKKTPIRLIPDPEEAPIVLQLFEKYLQGASLLGLVNWLEEKGVRPPKAKKKGKRRWMPASVRKVLNNVVYTGVRIWNRMSRSKHHTTNNGVVIPQAIKRSPRKTKHPPLTTKPQSEWIVSDEKHEAIVQEQLYEAVQRRLEKRRCGKSGANPKAKLLSGLLLCEHCRRTLVASQSKRNGWVEYRCPSNLTRKGLPCTNARVQQDVMMTHIIQVIKDTLLDEHKFAGLCQKISQQEDRQKQPANVKKLEEGIVKLKSEIAKRRGNLVLLEPEEIPDAREVIRPLVEKLKLLEEELMDASKPSAMETLTSYVKAVAAQIEILESCWRDGDQTALRRIVEQLISRVSVRWTKRTPKTGNPKYCYRIPEAGTIYVRAILSDTLAVINGLPEVTVRQTAEYAIPFTFAVS